jgi:hypothetical protein
MTILRTILLIVACVYMFGMLSAILENLRVPRFVSRSLAAVCTIIAGYTQTWLWILGFTAIAMLLYAFGRFVANKTTAR